MTRSFAMLIDGKPVRTKATFPVVNPATEEVIAEVPCLDDQGAEAALAAADRAFRVWSRTPLAERRAQILAYADLVDRHKDELIDLLVAETGKPIDNAQYDFGMLTTCLRFFVEEAERIKQDVLPDPEGRFLHYIQRQPLGVVVGLLAWNFPLLNLGYKLGPVLASGCTAIIKPSSLTPLATLRAVEFLAEAGIPPGIVNVVTARDYDSTRRILESPIPSLVTMIGSTAAGVEIMRQAAASVKHFSLELGGNAPVVVYDDADLEDAANKIVDLKFTNTGQVCVSPNRCFVHESVYESFLTLARKRAEGIQLGSGRGDGRRMGPLMTAKARDRAIELVKDAVNGGAAVVLGGRRAAQPAKGYFMEPTILRDVRPQMNVACEEIFGPVLPVIRFGQGDDVLAMANSTPHGLAAYVFTRDLSKGLRAASAIEAGSVCVNEPHYAVHLPHGGLKQSGVGKDCSHYSLEEYLTIKRVSVLL